MRIGQAEVDFDAHQIVGPEGTVSVEPKVMEVLSVLVANAGQVVSRDSLIDQVWGVGYGGDERLSRAISLLRKSLGDKPRKSRIIQTIHKTGYKLNLPAEAQKSAAKHMAINPIDMTDGTAVSEPQVVPARRNSWKALIPVISAAFLVVAAIINFSRFNQDTAPPEPPLVIIMDSAHPARIYDDQIRDSGGTNADILSDILADLPVRTQKELISPTWHRYEAIIQFDPDLIVIHYSGFKQEDASGDRPQLRLLMEYFLKTDTRFLVYSRASEDWLDHNLGIVLEEIYNDNPDMRDRVDIFPLMEYGEPNWMDQTSAQGIKLKIKDILALE